MRVLQSKCPLAESIEARFLMTVNEPPIAYTCYCQCLYNCLLLPSHLGSGRLMDVSGVALTCAPWQHSSHGEPLHGTDPHGAGHL